MLVACPIDGGGCTGSLRSQVMGRLEGPASEGPASGSGE